MIRGADQWIESLRKWMPTALLVGSFGAGPRGTSANCAEPPSAPNDGVRVGRAVGERVDAVQVHFDAAELRRAGVPEVALEQRAPARLREHGARHRKAHVVDHVHRAHEGRTNHGLVRRPLEPFQVRLP